MNNINCENSGGEQGIRFECVPGCANCCSISGYILVAESEFAPIAEFLGLTESRFRKQYIKRYWKNQFALNFPDDSPCGFLTEKGCRIYPVRPSQCETFPFWPENMTDLNSWETVRKMCPGIDRGRLYTIDEITDVMASAGSGAGF